MEKDKKKTSSQIDAELMMNLMEDGVKKGGLVAPDESAKNSRDQADSNGNEQPAGKTISKDKGRGRRGADADYENIFLRKTETNARDGKTVYIRPEFHDKLSRIVQVIGEDKITIYAYLDNLLEYHFKEFGEQITKSYNDKYKPIL